MGAFDNVNKVIVTDIYAASEDPIDGINSEKFTLELSKKVTCEHLSGDMKEVAKKLFPTLKSGDIVIGLGAGTINKLGPELVKLSEEVVDVAR